MSAESEGRGLLQFYFDMSAMESKRIASRTRATPSSRRAMRLLAACAGACVGVVVAGCGTTTSAPGAPAAAPPAPPINLQGFPPAYREGFGDGCATARGAERRDLARFGSDGNYRTGWQDGMAQCRAR